MVSLCRLDFPSQVFGKVRIHPVHLSSGVVSRGFPIYQRTANRLGGRGEVVMLLPVDAPQHLPLKKKRTILSAEQRPQKDRSSDRHAYIDG